MKFKQLLMQFVMLSLAIGAHAGSGSVIVTGTEQLFKEAIAQNTDVKLDQDIELTDVLVIPAGNDMAINLNGHTLSRNLTEFSDGGGIFRVEAGAKVRIFDDSTDKKGTLKDGMATRGGAIVNYGELEIQDITITGCSASFGGGAIYNAAPANKDEHPVTRLTVTNVKFTQNVSEVNDDAKGMGGSLYNGAGCIVTMTDCVFQKGNARLGGAIYNEGSLTLTKGEIYNNQAASGGGIYNQNGILTMNTGFLRDNWSHSGVGGGIVNAADATFDMRGGSVTKNMSLDYGGGVWSRGVIRMQGVIDITENLHGNTTGIYSDGGKNSNLYLSGSNKVDVMGKLQETVEGNIVEESKIGVLVSQTGFITNDYRKNTGETTIKYFFSDQPEYLEITWLLSMTQEQVDAIHEDMEFFSSNLCMYNKATDGKSWTDFAEEPTRIENNVVYIEKPEHLAWIAKKYREEYLNESPKEYRQMADLDMSKHNWIPIGNEKRPFEGVYNANGYTISGIRCNLPYTDNVGLFGSMGQVNYNSTAVLGSINDVILLNSKIVGRYNVGGICGNAHGGTINHCVSDAEVEGQETVGGIVGRAGDDISIFGALDLEKTTVSVQTSLYTGRRVTSQEGLYCAAVIGRKLLALPSSVNSYYTNDLLDGLNDTDVKAYPVYNNIKDVTLIFEPGVKYGNCQYIPKGNIKLTVGAADDYMQVTSVSFNDRPVGTGDGTYEVALQDGETEAHVTGDTGLKTLAGEGTDENPYQIHTDKDWSTLAAHVRLGNTYKGKVVRLMRHLTVSTMVGTPDNPFEGTLDGGFSTLTFNLGTSKEPFQESRCAPIRYYAGPLIKDLFVVGDIYTFGQMAAGIVGQLFPVATASEQTTEIRNCLSEVVIHSSYYGEACHGGLVGEKMGNENTVKFTYCAFSGQLLGENTDACSGFLGRSDWSDLRQNNGASFEHCLYYPKVITVKKTNNAAFSWNKVMSAKQVFVSDKSLVPNDKLAADIMQWAYKSRRGFFGNQLSGVAKAFFCERAVGVSPYFNENTDWWSSVVILDQDNNEDIEGLDGKTVDVCLKGQSLAKDGMFHGLCLPFDVSLTSGPLKGAKAFEMTSSAIIATPGKLNVTFEKVTGETLKAGVPYLVKYGDDGTATVNPVFDHVVISKTESPAVDPRVVFYGTFSRKVLSDEELENSYFIDDNQLYEDVVNRNAFDAYLKVTTTGVSEVAVIVRGDGDDIVMTMMTQLYGEGTAENPYLIRNVGDWEWLADKVELGETYSGKEFRLVNNITTNVSLGSLGTVDDKAVEYFFEGNFDGGGNTLTFIVTPDDADIYQYDYTAPFRYYGGTSIRNLTVAGTINSGKLFAAGLVGALFKYDDNKTLDVTDCRVSATLQSTYDEVNVRDAFFGGFVGEKRSGPGTTTLNFTRCVFDGELSGEHSSSCSGFVGRSYSTVSNVSLKDCLLAPKAVTMQGSYAFVDSEPSTVTNTYYTNWNGRKQGTEPFVFSNESKSFGAKGTENAFMTAYAKAVKFDGKYYANLPWEGEGTESSPYLIRTPEELREMQELLGGAGAARIGNYFKQAANLAFDKSVANNFTPVAAFTRHYDGDGYAISGLNVGASGNDYAALFQEAGENSTVKNVIIQNSDFSAPYAAPVVAVLTGNATVENCHVLKHVSATSDRYSAGGVVAYMNSENAQVVGCSSHASAASRATAGGVVGNVVAGKVSNSIYLGNTLRTNQLRGAVSAHYRSDAPAENSYFTASSLSDPAARLMAMENANNSDFLTLIHARDEYLRGANAHLAVSDYNYDLTLNGRTFSHDGNWNALCLPFDVSTLTGTPLEGATVKTLDTSSFAGGKLTLTFGDATAIEAGKPYFVKWESGSNVENPTFSGVTVTAAEAAAVESTHASFKGVLSPIGLAAGNKGVLSMGGDNKLYYPEADVTLGTYRAYFLLKGITVDDLADGVRSIELDFGDATGIVNVRADAALTDGYYTLDGRRLSGKPTKKGIYIFNGKRVVVGK